MGVPVAEWFYRHAIDHGHFNIDLVDLAALDLPMMDDPQPAEDDERALAALAELRRALDAADPDDRAFVLRTLDDAIRGLDVQRPV